MKKSGKLRINAYYSFRQGHYILHFVDIAMLLIVLISWIEGEKVLERDSKH